MPEISQSLGLFSSDPSQVRDLSGFSMGDFFNQHVVPSIDALDKLANPADALDLDGEDQLSAQRRQRQAQLNQQGGIFQDQQDQDLFARRRAERGQTPVQVTPNRPVMVRPGEQPYVGGDADADATSAPTGDLTSMIKGFESFIPNAYDDHKQISIGYGTRARKGEKTITKAAAEKRLGEELSKKRSHVESFAKKHKYNFNANQLDALTSFAYNVGSINELTDNGKRTPAQISAKMPEYRKASGKVSKGLVKRRKAEQQLFNRKS